MSDSVTAAERAGALREKAEAIIRDHDFRCAGEYTDEPWCGGAPADHPLCAGCTALADAIETALKETAVRAAVRALAALGAASPSGGRDD